MLKTRIIAMTSTALMITACTTTDPNMGETRRDNTKTGAIVGAVAGAVAGYLTNTSDSEQARKNAMIGAGIGALAGAGVGHYMDKQQKQLEQDLAGTGVEVDRRGDKLYLTMPSDVTFSVNSAEIQPRFYTVLNDVAHTLNAYPATYLDVIGHADSTGDAAYNQQLSERRASNVARYLTAQGVLHDRLYVEGKGETQPVAFNATMEGRARNRRVELIITPHTEQQRS